MSLLLALQVAGGGQTLLPSLVTDTDTFFGEQLNLVVFPSLATDTDVFFSPTVTTTVSLFPSLYNDTDIFFAATVTTGAVTLSPPLVTDDDVFFSATLSQVTVLSPSLVTDTDTFFGPTVTVGSVTLLPSLVTDADTFFSATITTGSVSLTPGLYNDSDVFFAPVVTTGSVNLNPGLSDVPSVFFDSVVTQDAGGGEQTLFPDLFINVTIFFGEYLGGIDEGGGKQRRGEKYIEVDSSNIHSVYYDKEGVLRVRFNSGPVYAYKDVPQRKVERLIRSRSPGTFLHKNIVNKYNFRKMT
jgi:hypothetical protein